MTVLDVLAVSAETREFTALVMFVAVAVVTVSAVAVAGAVALCRGAVAVAAWLRGRG